MRLGTILRLAGVGATALVVALVAVVKSIDVNDYRGVVERAATAATGRHLTIRGKFSLRLSLTPALLAEDVSLSNAPGASRGEMLHLQRLRADIELLPLLLREVRINRLGLDGPDIVLERDASGRGNWDFGAHPAAALSVIGAAKTPLAVKISQVTVLHGRVVYRDAVRGIDKTLAVDQFTADADTMASPIGLHALGTWDGQHFEVSGVLGAVNALSAAAKPYPVKLKAVLPGLVATANGTVTWGTEKAPAQLALQATADATDLTEAAKLAGYALPSLGAARVAMRIDGPWTSPGFTNIEAVLGRRDMAVLTVKGSAKAPLDGQGIDLLLFAEGETLAGFNRALPVALPPVGPVRGAARLSDSEGGWHLADLKVAVGRSDLSGDLSLALRNQHPSVEAHLSSGLLDLGELTGIGNEPPRPAPEAARIFSDDALPLPALGLADAELVWKIDRLTSGGLNAQKIDLTISDRGGKLGMTANMAELAGGKALGALSVDAPAKSAALTVDAEKVGLGDVLKGLGVSRNVEGVGTTLHLALKGTGGTPHALMARMSGDVTVIGGKGVLDQTSPDMAVLDVLRQLEPSRARVQLQCLVGRFTVVDGMAHSEALLFDTDVMTLGAQGSINLGNELLDLTAAPKPKDLGPGSLASPLDIGGTLVHPTVTANRGTIVKGVPAVSNAAALEAFAGTVGESGNACLAAILSQSPAKKAPPPKKSGGKGPAG